MNEEMMNNVVTEVIESESCDFRTSVATTVINVLLVGMALRAAHAYYRLKTKGKHNEKKTAKMIKALEDDGYIVTYRSVYDDCEEFMENVAENEK